MMQFRIQSKELYVTLTNAVGIRNYRIVVRHEVEELDADNQAGCNKLLFFSEYGSLRLKTAQTSLRALDVTRLLSGIPGF
jgi:hypothetical protein